MNNASIPENTNESDFAETPEKKLSRLKLEREELKINELKQRITDSKKPAYKKSTFWTSSFTIIIALGGIFGQNILSSIKSERAELEVKEAMNKKDSAEKSVKEIENAKDLASQEYALLKKRSDSVKQSLALIQADLNNLPSTKQTDSIKKLINKSQTQLNEISPRVYIQIANESQRSIAKTLQNELLKNNFLVPGIENVSRVNAKIPGKTEVRYYNDKEKDKAITIINLLQKLRIGEPINEIPQKIFDNGNNNRPQHYEIWFTGS